ncbi:hypothetical protein TeGR_g14978, partial [Tetraparma gracilis]
FHSSGREDADVRMLDSAAPGRPFCLECTDMKYAVTPEMLRAAEAELSGAPNGVSVSGLRLACREDFSGLQKATEGKVKHYACVCWSEARLESQAHLDRLGLADASPTDILQRTPLRVLHRRPLLDRPRRVLYLRAEYLNPHWFTLHLATTAGTYVKEFVTGDLGRTRPSVASMVGGRCDILQLDCVGIDA